jgi:pyruvyltransferase
MGFLQKNDDIKLYWHNSEPNFGDQLSPWVVENVFGKCTQFTPKSRFSKHVYASTGSIFHHFSKRFSHVNVWGSGIMSPELTIKSSLNIFAVRGPNTAGVLKTKGIVCPPAYGDPAVLLPLFHNSPISKRYRYGVVPHFIDITNPWVQTQSQRDDVLFIDVMEPPQTVIDKIRECDMILSSSLHGNIVAHAYGIPSVWVRLSDRVKGGDFKFLDYYASTGIRDIQAVAIDSDSTLPSLETRQQLPEVSPLQTALLENAPFPIALDKAP